MARDFAEVCAYLQAWCDGPPFSYAAGLDEARANISAVGAPEPDGLDGFEFPSASGLSDLGWVIRGGTMQTQSLLLAIDKAERQLGRPGISVYAADLPTVAELLVSIGPRLPQPQIYVTQVGGLRCADIEIEQTGVLHERKR